MPRKHKNSKPRNIEKIKRKREKRKAEKAKLLAETDYKNIIQSHVSHQKQAEFVAAHEYPGMKIAQNENEQNLWYVLSEDGMHARTYTLGEILRKFRRYTGRELSKYEMIQEIVWHLNFMCSIEDVKKYLEQL